MLRDALDRTCVLNLGELATLRELVTGAAGRNRKTGEHLGNDNEADLVTF